MKQNSLDLLRLVAAVMVLYSHQYALLGLAEPWFLGLKTFGTAGVSIFFFLSGCLVWTSWMRDPHLGRFAKRRALRILPALLVVCLASVFILGASMSTIPLGEYLLSPVTWRYVLTLGLSPSKVLPGLFPDNPLPLVVNGALWTLPVELMCYGTVAAWGMLVTRVRLQHGIGLVVGVSLAVLLASYGTLLIDTHFEPHLEMVAFFWWGAFYGYCRRARCDALPLLMAVLALLAFVQLGPHGPERTAMLVCAAGLVHLAMGVSSGARLTGPFGDLSYGVYIMAFPVQQLGVHLMHGLDWSLPAHLALSVAGTLGLAYASWHLIEKRALRFKPGGANR